MAKLFASEAGKEVVEDCVPHPRRLRLLQGVRDRAALPRRAAAADRRGDLGDPADGHRPEAAAAPQALSTGAAARSAPSGSARALASANQRRPARPSGTTASAGLVARQPRAGCPPAARRPRRRAARRRARLGARSASSACERCVGRGVEDDDEVGRARLVEQPGSALAVGRVGGDGLEDPSTMPAQAARDGVGEPVGGSDHEGVHASQGRRGQGGAFPGGRVDYAHSHGLLRAPRRGCVLASVEHDGRPQHRSGQAARDHEARRPPVAPGARPVLHPAPPLRGGGALRRARGHGPHARRGRAADALAALRRPRRTRTGCGRCSTTPMRTRCGSSSARRRSSPTRAR